jgi:hypothetical protein
VKRPTTFVLLPEIWSIGNVCRVGAYSVSILETRTLNGESGGLDSVKGQVVVNVNAPQEERKDAIALFESHLACIAVVR